MKPDLLHQQEIEAQLAPALEALGLSVFGWFLMADAPFSGRVAALIGNRPIAGKHQMWEVFSSSQEYADGQANPLDRWTERLVKPIATGVDAVTLFPFGKNLWPFQRYAKQATGMQNSPLGMLIHPEYGLWQAFRAVLVFNMPIDLAPAPGIGHPCETCSDKPCLGACPVGAFTKQGFEVDRCRNYLRSKNQPDCMSVGCRARAACPFGRPYSAEQTRFHMAAFGE